MELQIGATANRSLEVTDERVRAFADVSGDHNPVHLDEKYASTTRFGKRIAHGMLAASLISAVLGNDLPGPGTIYLSQELRFMAPVFIGDTITAVVTVTNLRDDKPVCTLETVCYNQKREPVLKGQATVLAQATH